MNFHCRQTQVQDGGSIFSKTASIGLLDILHELPTLPDLLNPDAQKALSATCKIYRLWCIAQIQVVTVVRKEDYALAPQVAPTKHGHITG